MLEQYKLLAESLVSRCKRARHGAAQVGGTSASTRTCFRSTRLVRSLVYLRFFSIVVGSGVAYLQRRWYANYLTESCSVYLFYVYEATQGNIRTDKIANEVPAQKWEHKVTSETYTNKHKWIMNISHSWQVRWLRLDLNQSGEGLSTTKCGKLSEIVITLRKRRLRMRVTRGVRGESVGRDDKVVKKFLNFSTEG